MSWLKAVWGEVFGLFVDDGPLAAAILVWVALVWLGIRYFGFSLDWAGPALFVGLAVILVESVRRGARR